MNLQSKKARIPISALGVAALACGAGALFNPAQAVGTDLGFGPTATSATIVDVDPNGSTSNQTLTYGFKVTGSSGTTPMLLSAASTNPGSLYMADASGNNAPVSTTLSSASLTTSTTFNVVSSAGIAVGSTVTINGATNVTVTAVPSTTSFSIGAATGTAYGAGTSVTHNIGTYTAVTAGNSGTVTGYTNGDNIFVGATVPGDYTFFAYRDLNANGQYDATQDDATPTFTLHVKDVTANTSTTSDDLNFGLTAPGSVNELGRPIPASATMTGLTTGDTRGTNALGYAVAAATSFSFGGSASGQANTGPAMYNPTAGTFSRSSGTVTAAGTVITTATLGSSAQTATTNVTSNSVTSVSSLTAPAVTGSVAMDTGTPTQVDVKTGTGSVTYTALAKDTNGNPVSGVKVYFTLSGSATNLGKLTTDGTTVDTTSSTTSAIYSATTNSSGVASLKVTSSDTTTAMTYGVTAESNNVNAAAPASLTVVYQNAAASTVKITSSASDLTPAAGSGASATIKGALTDQFGAPFTTTSGSQQAQVFIRPTTAGPCTAYVVPNNTSTTDPTVTANVVVTSGTFSYTYTPSTAPSVGQCTPFAVGYDGSNNGTLQTSETAGGVINWASSTAAASLTLSTPNDQATGVSVQGNAAPNAATGNTAVAPSTVSFGNTTGAVTGTVYDANGVGLAYKSVTLTGGDGVYFSSVQQPNGTNDTLHSSLTTITNNAGAIQNAYVFFTKSGAHTVTATSGSASKTATVTVVNPTTGSYTVTAMDTAGTPGSTMILTGTVTDIFGNGVSGVAVNLTTDPQTIGVVTTAAPVTNSQGDWSTTFVTGSNQNGTVKLHATVAGAASTPNTTLVADGITGLPANSDLKGDATITVGNVAIGIGSDAVNNVATAGATGARVAIKGSFIPGATMQIMEKPSGASAFAFIGAALVKADGTYQKTFTVKKSAVFIAQSQGIVSPTKTITIKSSVSLTASSSKAGMVTLEGNGNPNGKYKLAFYRVKSGADPRVAYVTGNADGVAKVTVSAPRGTDQYYVRFQATGTSVGTSKTVSVKVK